jgi:phosphatidylethanolamine-binding protein (PEBP) family uncharacterized protein
MNVRLGSLIGLVAAVALAGCGGGSKAATAAGGATTPVGQASAAGEAVATVGPTPISKVSLEHWMSVTAALSHSKAHSKAARAALESQVLGFLISSQWVLGEAAHLGLGASEAEVRQRLGQETAKQYPTHAKLEHYLVSIGETEADLLMRIRIELLEAKIARHVTVGKTVSTEPHLLLSDFQRGFEVRWRARTSCAPGYVMEDCKESKGTPKPPAASSSSSTASSSHASQAASSNASGEIPATPGAMAVSSPAFERNGAIPPQYTCDGANISLPLQWQSLPVHTAELVLFVIDDSSDGSEGGIRWVVAGIDPSLTGVAAGQTPAGAVVGMNGSSKATYGGICPPKGKSATIEIVLWALSKTIPLSNGFIPAVAEHEYAHSELGSATDYATYQRR